jgi:N4-(beta-N-acetylglucosaminyl)-L-asparaginase
MHPQAAAERVVYQFTHYLTEKSGKAGAMSVIAMNNYGEWGVGTNVEFSFVAASPEEIPIVYVGYPIGDKTVCEPASEEWLEAYTKRITSPVE